MNRFIPAFLTALIVSGCANLINKNSPMTLVENGVPAVPIIVAKDAPAANRRAAVELAAAIEKISGAKPDVLDGAPDPSPTKAIWIGSHPDLKRVFTGVDFSFKHPEEILIVCDGENAAILGRDRTVNGERVEFGTANAVNEFIRGQLGIRRLWPGELGEDVVERKTIRIDPFERRFHPPFRFRQVRYASFVANKREVDEWWRFQNCDTAAQHVGSLVLDTGYDDLGWRERFGEDHPEYFGLLVDGTRKRWRGKVEKLCVSNPEVADRWLEIAETELRDNPSQATICVAPSDSGGWCFCPNCLAMDHPDGPESVFYGKKHVMLTDRYVKFWNELARRLKKRFPNRDVKINTLAYTRYKTPPVDEDLEDNLIISHVGNFPLTSSCARHKAKREFNEWADKAMTMTYRPNLFYWGGGLWGLPEVALKETAEDFRFLAENKCVGLDIDSVHMNCATLGPQLYLIARLAYDPWLDADAVLKDYYHRGFGPAASDVEDYFNTLDHARGAVIDHPDMRLGGNFYRRGLLDVFQDVYDEEFFAKADRTLRQAAAKVADGPEKYRQRVAFLRDGFDFTKLMIDVIPVMAKVRKSGGNDRAAVKKATELAAAREDLLKTAEPFALDRPRIEHQIKHRIGPDYFGPPSKRFLEAIDTPAVILAPAKWRLAFSDDFENGELSENWKIVHGSWRVENGALVTKGGTLVSAKPLTGLQRIEFDAVAANETCSDLSSFIQAGEKDFLKTGYFAQFGGAGNTVNGLRRQGVTLEKRNKPKITPGKVHKIVTECDGNHVRLIVDGETIFDHVDDHPLLGEGHDRLGFYFWTPTSIDNVKVFTAEPKNTSKSAKDWRVGDVDAE